MKKYCEFKKKYVEYEEADGVVPMGKHLVSPKVHEKHCFGYDKSCEGSGCKIVNGENNYIK